MVKFHHLVLTIVLISVLPEIVYGRRHGKHRHRHGKHSKRRSRSSESSSESRENGNAYHGTAILALPVEIHDPEPHSQELLSQQPIQEASNYGQGGELPVEIHSQDPSQVLSQDPNNYVRPQGRGIIKGLIKGLFGKTETPPGEGGVDGGAVAGGSGGGFLKGLLGGGGSESSTSVAGDVLHTLGAGGGLVGGILSNVGNLVDHIHERKASRLKSFLG